MPGRRTDDDVGVGMVATAIRPSAPRAIAAGRSAAHRAQAIDARRRHRHDVGPIALAPARRAARVVAAASADHLQTRRDARRPPPARSGRSIRSSREWRSRFTRCLERRGKTARRKSSASMRSSTPPCPGISDELSFTPAARFSTRLEQVAADAERHDQHAEQDQRTGPGNGQHSRGRQRHESGRRSAADRAFDRLLRADRRRQRMRRACGPCSTARCRSRRSCRSAGASRRASRSAVAAPSMPSGIPR